MTARSVEVRASRIQGLGLFALRAFSAGDRIRVVTYTREVTEAEPLNTAAGERAEHCTYEDGRVLLVAYPDQHMNHGCDPNACYSYEADGVITRARRRIRRGEELTVDYLISNPGGDSWPCHCGAPRCRGETGKSFFTLPADVQREYLPLLAPWFVARFGERLAALGRGKT